MKYNLIQELRETIQEHIVTRLLFHINESNISECIIEHKRLKRIKILKDGTSFLEEILHPNTSKEEKNWKPLWELPDCSDLPTDESSLILVTEAFLDKIDELDKKRQDILNLIKRGKSLELLYEKQLLIEKIQSSGT